MNARASENYLTISRSSSASKSVEIFWAEIYWGRLIFRAESSLIQTSCRSFIGVIGNYNTNFHKCLHPHFKCMPWLATEIQNNS